MQARSHNGQSFYGTNLPAETAAKTKEANKTFPKTFIFFVQAWLYAGIYSHTHVCQPETITITKTITA